jgi:hypothetical protein
MKEGKRFEKLCIVCAMPIQVTPQSKVGKTFEKLTMKRQTFLKPHTTTENNFQFEFLALTQHQIVTLILMEAQRDSLVRRNI